MLQRPFGKHSSSFTFKACDMATKQKLPKNKFAEKDRADNQKFILILVGATLLLMGLMYFIFVG
jgi:hypothetical protein